MSDITVTVTDDTDISLTVSPTADLSSSTTDDLNEGSTNFYYTDEKVDDRVNSLLVAGSNISLTYDDEANTLTIAGQPEDNLSNNTTDDLAQGSTNLYYTDARVQTKLGDVSGHVLPDTDDTYDLGSPTKQWRELYLGPSSLYIDGVQLISSTATDVNFTTTAAAGQNIVMSPDGEVRLTPTGNKVLVGNTGTELEINGSLDLNGNANISGTVDSVGNITQLTGSKLNTNKIENVDTNGLNIVSSNFVFVDLNETHSSNTQKFIVGNNSQAVGIDATSIGAGVGTAPNITANNLTVNGTLSGITTDDVAEGSNLYYTDAKADARVNLQTGANLDLSSKSTSDLTEGTRLYFTDARARAVSIENVSEDTTPQLGGDLDLNSNNITGTGNIDTTGSLTLSGDITGDSGAMNIVNISDGSDMVFKIDDTGGTTDTAMTLTFDDYQHNDTVGGGGTTETRYKSFILQEGHGIKIGADGEFSSTGATPDNDAGDYQINGVLINPTGNTWPAVTITGTGQSKDGSNPLRDRLGDGVAGGFYSQFPNNLVTFNAADDTIASPSALSSGRRMGQFAFQGYDGNNYGGSGSAASVALTVSAIETHSTTNDRAGKMTFEFTAAGGDGSGGRTTVLTLDQTGADINGTLDVSGTADLAGTVNVTGTLNADGNFTVDGNTTLGNGSSDTVLVNGRFTDHLITNNISHLGSDSQRWGFVYAEDLEISANANVESDVDVGRDLTVTRNMQVDGSQVDFTNLPTADPLVAGRLWRSGNDVKISTG